jgi:hypothetical protein
MSSRDWRMAHSLYDERYSPAFRSGCSGTFRVIEDDGRTPAWVECDRCSVVVTVSQAAVRSTPPAQPTDAMPMPDSRVGWPF